MFGVIGMILGVSIGSLALGGDAIDDALRADARGDHTEALRIFKLHADQGDATAMQTVGIKYYSGEGATQDYCAAMDWFLKAVEKNNADALNALGVMHRDGKCAPVNRKIAYDIFLTIHMEGLGGQSTQMRANQNLRREVTELPQSDIREAVCYTPAYISSYLKSRGKLESAPPDTLPSEQRKRLKDLGWWMESEKKDLDFACPAPWG
jgi:TPR repeat protein